MSGVAPKDRTKHVQSEAAGARQGTQRTRQQKGDTLKTSEAISTSEITEDRGPKWILGDQTELRDNLAIY